MIGDIPKPRLDQGCRGSCGRFPSTRTPASYRRRMSVVFSTQLKPDSTEIPRNRRSESCRDRPIMPNRTGSWASRRSDRSSSASASVSELAFTSRKKDIASLGVFAMMSICMDKHLPTGPGAHMSERGLRTPFASTPISRSGHVTGRSSQRTGRPRITIEASTTTTTRQAHAEIADDGEVEPVSREGLRRPTPPGPAPRRRRRRRRAGRRPWRTRGRRTRWRGRRSRRTCRGRPGTPPAPPRRSASSCAAGPVCVKNDQPPRPVLRRTPRLSGPSLTSTSATSSP